MLVRAGVSGELVRKFIERGQAVVGWSSLGDLSSAGTAEELEEQILKAYPDARKKDGRVNAHHWELGEFLLEAHVGDLALTVDSRRRVLIIGEITGGYRFLDETDHFSGGEVYRHARPVRWKFEISRDNLDKAAINDIDGGQKTAVFLKPETVETVLSATRSPLTKYLGSKASPVDTDWEPTADREELEYRAEIIRRSLKKGKPVGVDKPERIVSGETVSFKRSPGVVAWVLDEAKGICEACSGAAPFKKESGEPFLEVHHVKFLSEGGSDSIENAVAVCPNCHRQLHYGKDRAAALKSLYEEIPRLVPYP